MRHLLFVDLRTGQRLCVDPRQHPQHFLHGAHVFHLLELLVKVGQRQLACPHFAFQVDRLLLVKVLLRLFNQRQHVAHPKDARSHTVGVEGFDIVKLFAGADIFDRLAGHGLD